MFVAADCIVLRTLSVGKRPLIGGWSRPQTGFFPRERDPLPIVQESGLTPGPVWTIAEMSPLPEFDPRTDQPVDSHYTD